MQKESVSLGGRKKGKGFQVLILVALVATGCSIHRENLLTDEQLKRVQKCKVLGEFGRDLVAMINSDATTVGGLSGDWPSDGHRRVAVLASVWGFGETPEAFQAAILEQCYSNEL